MPSFSETHAPPLPRDPAQSPLQDSSAQADRWAVQLRKGTLEMAALAALWRGRQYGLEILRHLEEHSALVLAEGTIYPLLNRLKAEHLVTAEWVEAEAGHPRKYYALTPTGRDRLVAMTRAWSAFTGGVNRLLQPVLSNEHTASDQHSQEVSR